MNLIKPAKYFFTLSAILVVISIGLFVFQKPKMSIEFTGGTRAEITAVDPAVTKEGVEAALRTFDKDLSATVNVTQGGVFLVRMASIDNEKFERLIEHISSEAGEVHGGQFTTIGPTVGSSLKRRSAFALFLATIGIILYVAWAFRKVPKKLNAWKFGLAAVATLLHDIIITVGIFTVLSHITSFEVNTLFVTALLTILGYSVNDTIIIFDRIRDNIFEHERGEDFPEIANRSLLQTLRRSCYTVVATLIMLTALFLFGNENIRWFVLTLIVGISVGTYSSVFVATPLLVYWRKK